MAAPESVRQSAGISATGYSPVVTQLSTPNMGSPGAGQLWAQVGDTAMKASQMLQNSALNPLVRAQMQEGVARAQAGIANLQYAQSLPPAQRFLLSRETPQGYEQIAPAESGAKVFPYFQPKLPTDPNAPLAPPAPAKAPGTGKQPLIRPTTPTTPTTPSDSSEKKKDPTEPPADITSTTNANPNLYASSGSGPLPTYGNENVKFPGGSFQPGGSFLNPATGSYQPLQTQPPAAPADDQAARDRATVQQHQAEQDAQDQQQQAQQSQVAAQQQAAGQAKQQQLAQWQAQNAHPVADSQSALEWAKRYHTGYRTATYLPHGGPGGEPAYNFSDGKSANIVPISQMVKNGFGPSVAAQSTSAVLGVADQIGQNGQGPTGPGLPFGPVSPAAQPAQQPPTQQPPVQAPPPGQQPPPPAAPGPSPPSGVVWNPQQPAPGQPAPPAPGAYDVGPYRQAVAQAMARPGALAAEAGQQAGTRTDIAAQPPQPDKSQRIALTDQEKGVFTPEAIANARANAKPDGTANDNGDPHVGELGPYHLYRDDTYGTGELYAARPGLTNLFKQQRLMLGSDGWDEYELPTTNMRMNMEAEFGGGKGSVNGAPMSGLGVQGPSDQKFPAPFSTEEIANMPVPKMQRWLELAGRYHNTNAQPNDPEAQRLTLLGDASQRIKRMADGMDAADKAGLAPNMYNTAAQYQSHQARKRDESVPPGGWETQPTWWDPYGWNMPVDKMPNALMYAYHNSRAAGSQKNAFSNYLEEQSQALNNDITQLQGSGPVPFLTKPQEGMSASVYGPGWGGSFKQGYDPYHSVTSPHIQVQNMFAGDEDPKESRKNLLSLKAEYDKRFIQEYEQAITANWRPTAQAVQRYNSLKKGGSIADDANSFKDSSGQTTNPFTTGHEPPSGQSQNLPLIKSRAQMDDFKKTNPGKQFQWVDEHGVYHTETAAGG